MEEENSWEAYIQSCGRPLVPANWRQSFQGRLKVLVCEYLQFCGVDGIGNQILENAADDERRLAAYDALVQEIYAIRAEDPLWQKEQAEMAEYQSKHPARDPIPQSIRRQVHERDEYKCVKCGSQKHLVIDHIHPVVLGGKNHVSNLRTLCRNCNLAKGGRIEGPL